MHAISPTLEPGNPILGVFGFLDAILTPEMMEEAAQYDVEKIREHLSVDSWPYKSVRIVVRKTIHDAFRLQYWGCPLREELDKFRLYFRDDMADALAVAYFLQKRGADPIGALTADYGLKPFGILTWEHIDKIRDETHEDYNASEWRQFSNFYQQGDRFIRYHNPTSSGLLLVRGDRLVWEDEQVIKEVSRVSLRWETNYEHFKALGGNKGFLAGDFDWPDPNWVNPITDEQENESLGKRVMGVIQKTSTHLES